MAKCKGAGASPCPSCPPKPAFGRRRMRGRVRGGGLRIVADRESTNPISRRCTARNPCPIAPAPRCPTNPPAGRLRANRPATPRLRVRPGVAVKWRRTWQALWVEETIETRTVANLYRRQLALPAFQLFSARYRFFVELTEEHQRSRRRPS